MAEFVPPVPLFDVLVAVNVRTAALVFVTSYPVLVEENNSPAVLSEALTFG